MQFIRFKGVLINNKLVDKLLSKDTARRELQSVRIKTMEFNEKQYPNAFVFVANINEDFAEGGIILDSFINASNLLSKYLKAIGITLTDIVLDEITLKTMTYTLAMAKRYGAINDDDEILENFHIDYINYGFRDFTFDENLLEETSKEDIFKAVLETFSNESLVPELFRIFKKQVKPGTFGHPCHYFVQTDSKDLREIFCKSILSALKLSGRINQKRFCYLNIRPGASFSRAVYEDIYKSNIGGAMIISVTANNFSENEHASVDTENISILSEIAEKYRNQVLTIFCFPRECTKIKSMFKEYLGNMTFIDISEDAVDVELAKDYFKRLAKKNSIRIDKALTSKLKEGEFYLSNELEDMFFEWYNIKLKNTVFPEYKEIESIKKNEKKETPKGNAYDELSEMIGLNGAKKVIKQALDYYKAQKLFKDKGMGESGVALHMCFTGDPGTAKTSVARLFSRIMKDNKLLSKGHLVELTANELKGKYVGWTGPQVKKAFAAARGGVLFLDEAYSLVEDRDGGFGDEAIAAIVAEMENHRDDVVVIFAGYKNEMGKFLKKNPGLKSRIAFHVDFDSYSTEDLVDISKLIAKKKGRVLSSDAVEKLYGLYESERRNADFGNGRFARNVIEQAMMQQASRLVSMDYDSVTKDDIRTLIADDITIKEPEIKAQRIIGFCA